MALLKIFIYIAITLSINSVLVDAANAVCQDDFANLCSNVMSDAECDAIYTTAPAPAAAPKTVDEKCLTSPTIAVSMCPLRCLACCKTPAYDCQDLNGGLGISCDDARKNKLCSTTDTVIRQQLEKFCPHSCGLCVSSSSTCKDLDPVLCKDKQNECAINKDFMSRLCPKTCGICTDSGGESGTCVNTDARCATWVKNGFCTEKFYNDDYKRKFCAKSCNLCS